VSSAFDLCSEERTVRTGELAAHEAAVGPHVREQPEPDPLEVNRHLVVRVQQPPLQLPATHRVAVHLCSQQYMRVPVSDRGWNAVNIYAPVRPLEAPAHGKVPVSSSTPLREKGEEVAKQCYRASVIHVQAVLAHCLCAALIVSTKA
jgi:hypothetical protein